MRVEHTDLDLNQVTTAVQASNKYTNYLPSLFLTYKLDPNTNIRLSYADRISRPNAGDLNPFINYANDYYVSSGNPRLHPVKLHSLELGYETRVMGLMPVSARGYLRREGDVITDRRVFLERYHAADHQGQYRRPPFRRRRVFGDGHDPAEHEGGRLRAAEHPLHVQR